LHLHGTMDGLQRATGLGQESAYRLYAEAKAAGLSMPHRPSNAPRIPVDVDEMQRVLAISTTQVEAAARLGITHATLKRRLRESRATRSAN
jgi:predicted DNA-binding protein (UPF0251 family)